MTLIKQELDTWLDQVSYKHLNSNNYVPTDFSLSFMNFIKMVNGEQGESNKTPPVHLAMLDKVVGDSEYIVNLCHRGSGKTTLFMEYLTLYLSFYNYIPNFGRVDGFIYVSDSMDNGVKSARQNIEYRYRNSDFMQYYVPDVKFTDNYLEFRNRDGYQLGVKMFGATTGLRGTKIFGKRPTLAVLDDLISDKAAKSQADMTLIKDTVYKGINNALDPTKRKVIFNGTPFNKEDIIIEAVESGAWDVNVWPVCERFPCSEEEFQGSWPDRFTYKFVKSQYDMAVKTGKLAAFNQELMLRITSEDERLIQDSEIKWYSRTQLLNNKQNFNFYITTDFATSEKETADYTVISVWAYNANGDWFWVDGLCERQPMNKTVDALFRYVLLYKPQQVGIEITGQQGGFIPWLQKEMMTRNIWFNFASSDNKSNSPGIRPAKDKLTRMHMVTPWFKTGKMYFPEEMKLSNVMGMFMQQIKLATINGLKGKDDCLDTISMLAYLTPWKPAEAPLLINQDGEFYEEDDFAPQETSSLSTYIV